MQIKDFTTKSERIKDILASYSRIDNVQTYCMLIDASEVDRLYFQRQFTGPQFRGIKLDATVIKKHIQSVENSGSGWLKYDKEKGFYLLDYI